MTAGMSGAALKVTSARSVARLTDTLSTPGTFATAFSTDDTQEAQLMPSTGMAKLVFSDLTGLFMAIPSSAHRAFRRSLPIFEPMLQPLFKGLDTELHHK